MWKISTKLTNWDVLYVNIVFEEDVFEDFLIYEFLFSHRKSNFVLFVIVLSFYKKNHMMSLFRDNIIWVTQFPFHGAAVT